MAQNSNTTPDINPASEILNSYLDGFTPAQSFGEGVYVLSTDEIISDLDVMAELDKETVNAALVSRGFVCGRNSHGTFGWLVMTAAD